MAFAAVLLARLLVPLAILRWPLPAILAAMVLDAVDRPSSKPSRRSNYQSYDKALGIVARSTT